MGGGSGGGGANFFFLYSTCFKTSGTFFQKYTFFIFGGPYVGSRGTKASGHEHLASKKIYVQQRKKINNQFVIYMGHIVKKMHFWLFWGSGGPYVGSRGTKVSGQEHLFTEKVCTRRKQNNNWFSYMSHNVKKCEFFGGPLQ